MAIYHCSVSTVGRSAGRSAVAAAAYRAAEKMQDKRTGEIHDYTRKEGVKYSEIIAPKDAPAWARERESLWNAAEAAENRKNSTVAREITVALPCELGPEARYQLAAEFAQTLSERYGIVVDMNIHHPKRQSAKDRPKGTLNYHAHLLMTTRRISPEGFTEKTRELDVKTSGEIEHIRAAWADHANRALNDSYKGFLYGSRIDHRSLKAQGIDRLPTKHLGPAATAMERRGIKTDKGRWNRRVAALHSARNRAARQVAAEERHLEAVVRRQEKWETAALLAQVQKPEAPRQVMHQAHDQAQQIHAPKQQQTTTKAKATEARRQDNAGGLGAAPPVQGAERPEAAVQQGAALPNHQPDLKAQEQLRFNQEIRQWLDKKTPEAVEMEFEKRKAERTPDLARFLAKRPEWQEWHQGREEYQNEKKQYGADAAATKAIQKAQQLRESAFDADVASHNRRVDGMSAFEKAQFKVGFGDLAKEKAELEKRKQEILEDKRKKVEPAGRAQKQRQQRMTELARRVAAERKLAGLGGGGKSRAQFEKEYEDYKQKAAEGWAKEVNAWKNYKSDRAMTDAAKAQEQPTKAAVAQERPTPAKVQEPPTKAQEQPAQADTAKGKATPEEKMLAEKARLLAVAKTAKTYQEKLGAERQAKEVEKAYLRTLTPVEQFKYKQRQEKSRGRGR